MMERRKRHAEQQRANREDWLRSNGGNTPLVEVDSDGEAPPLELVEPKGVYDSSNVNVSGVKQPPRGTNGRRSHLLWSDAFCLGENDPVTVENCPFCVRTSTLPDGEEECHWHRGM